MRTRQVTRSQTTSIRAKAPPSPTVAKGTGKAREVDVSTAELAQLEGPKTGVAQDQSRAEGLTTKNTAGTLAKSLPSNGTGRTKKTGGKHRAAAGQFPRTFEGMSNLIQARYPYRRPSEHAEDQPHASDLLGSALIRGPAKQFLNVVTNDRDSLYKDRVKAALSEGLAPALRMFVEAASKKASGATFQVAPFSNGPEPEYYSDRTFKSGANIARDYRKAQAQDPDLQAAYRDSKNWHTRATAAANSGDHSALALAQEEARKADVRITQANAKHEVLLSATGGTLPTRNSEREGLYETTNPNPEREPMRRKSADEYQIEALNRSIENILSVHESDPKRFEADLMQTIANPSRFFARLGDMIDLNGPNRDLGRFLEFSGLGGYSNGKNGVDAIPRNDVSEPLARLANDILRCSHPYGRRFAAVWQPQWRK